MRRKLHQMLGGLLALALGLTLLAGCGSNDNSNVNQDARDGRVGRSYVYGPLDGALASELMETFKPLPWDGQTNGVLLMSSDTLLGLTASQKAAAQAIIKSGQHAVLVTSALDQHVGALHALTGTTAAIALDRMPGRYGATELYGFAQPDQRMQMIVAPPFGALDGPEPDSSKQARADYVATWIQEKVRGIAPPFIAQGSPNPDASKQARADLATTWIQEKARETEKLGQQNQASQSTGTTPLSPDSFPWTLAVADAMTAYWTTCDSPTYGCVNQVQLYIDAWMVYLANAGDNQPSDYFIMKMSSDISTAGCKDFYGNRNHSDRIAGYWLRQANMSASVSGLGSFNDLKIDPDSYGPKEANPKVSITTGMSWSLSGSGTAGDSAAGSSLGFSGGVSYTDDRTIIYDALATQVNIGADSYNAATWTYDSWNFVRAGIEPGNRACGGPGLRVQQALPSIIYGGTFSPVQSWVWQAQPSVRTQFGGKALPVTVDTSLLLGWTYYAGGRQCGARESMGKYTVADGFMNPVDVVGYPGDQGNGITFDVSCLTTTNYGTIPLGPWGPDGQDNDAGNPGTPYSLPSWQVNIPFAPTAAPSLTLTSLSPTSGPIGTPVTLTGTNLTAATTVNFGGSQITSFSRTPQGAIRVTAPTGSRTVDVTVSNTSSLSNPLQFTYTQ